MTVRGCVSGGGSGIGRAVCQALAKEGAAVAAADINRQHVEETVSLLDTGTAGCYGDQVHRRCSSVAQWQSVRFLIGRALGSIPC